MLPPIGFPFLTIAASNGGLPSTLTLPWPPPGLMKVQRVPAVQNRTCTAGTCLDKGIPTARLPERGLRESEDHEPPVCGHGIMWRGSGWPPIKGSPRYTVLKSAPSMPLPPRAGEGEDAEGGLLPCDRRGS